jgi:hypothetical protein
MSARIGQLKIGAAIAAVCLGSAGCGDVVREGRAPTLLVIDSLSAASGAKPGQFSAPLLSDVLTLVKQNINGVDVRVPTIFDDFGQATLRIVLKNQGGPGGATTPSTMNAVTISRYHVEFIRADGRNTQGVDVPYAFDGAVTGTIGTSSLVLPFELVRHNAKEEAPLKALANNGGQIFISTIAHITFYGKDLAGNDVTGSGDVSVNFSDFADPQ